MANNRSWTSILGGAGGLFGSIISAISAAAENRKNRRHDRAMAEMNQQYNLQNMEQQQEYNLATLAQQNGYQLEQWNRENQFNDPTAVGARYRSAGINPRAVFGSGSANGAGISGGFSSAPSGGAPSGSGPMGSAHPNANPGAAFAGLDISGLVSLKSVIENRNADTEYTTAKAIEQKIINLHKEEQILTELEKQRADIVNTKQDTEESKKRIEELNQRIAESKQRIAQSSQEIKESQSRERLNARKLDVATAEIGSLNSQAGMYDANKRRANATASSDERKNAFYDEFGYWPGESVPKSFLGMVSKLPEKTKSTIQAATSFFAGIDKYVEDAFVRYITRNPKIKDAKAWLKKFKNSLDMSKVSESVKNSFNNFGI